MSDWFQDVLDFHEKFDCYISDLPKPMISGREELLRVKLMEEEFEELKSAINKVGTGRTNEIDIADALADLIYVTLGTAVAYGIDLRPVWDEVHKTNMAKTGGGVREDGKILKPEGWKPPEIGRVLDKQEPLK